MFYRQVSGRIFGLRFSPKRPPAGKSGCALSAISVKKLTSNQRPRKAGPADDGRAPSAVLGRKEGRKNQSSSHRHSTSIIDALDLFAENSNYELNCCTILLFPSLTQRQYCIAMVKIFSPTNSYIVLLLLGVFALSASSFSVEKRHMPKVDPRRNNFRFETASLTILSAVNDKEDQVEIQDGNVANQGNFDGDGFANYLGPYIVAFVASIAVTVGFVKFVLMDY